MYLFFVFILLNFFKLILFIHLYPVQHLLTLGVSRSFVQDELSFRVLRKSLFENLLYILSIFEAIWKEDTQLQCF